MIDGRSLGVSPSLVTKRAAGRSQSTLLTARDERLSMRVPLGYFFALFQLDKSSHPSWQPPYALRSQRSKHLVDCKVRNDR